MGMSARHHSVHCRRDTGDRPPRRRTVGGELALSLHAADDHLREQLVPLNRRYPIDELLGAGAAIPRRARASG